MEKSEENMKNIKIIRTGSYLPKEKVTDKELEEKLNLEKGYIKKRTGIETRYYVKDETIEEMAKEAVLDLIKKEDIKDEIDQKKKINNKIILKSKNKMQDEINKLTEENIHLKFENNNFEYYFVNQYHITVFEHNYHH